MPRALNQERARVDRSFPEADLLVSLALLRREGRLLQEADGAREAAARDPQNPSLLLHHALAARAYAESGLLQGEERELMWRDVAGAAKRCLESRPSASEAHQARFTLAAAHRHLSRGRAE